MVVLGCLQIHIAHSDLFPGAPYGGNRVRAVPRARPPASLGIRGRLNDRLAACNSAQSHMALIAALTAETGTATSQTPAWVLLGAVGIPAAQTTLICTQKPPNFDCSDATAASGVCLGVHGFCGLLLYIHTV